MFVITGGGSGIGQALALELVRRKKPVMIVGRRLALLQDMAARDPLIRYCCADVATKAGREHIVTALQDIPSITALIHNAGVVEPIVPTAEITEGDWDKTLATNLTAPLFLTQLLLDKLVHGRVLHIGSGAAHFPVNAWAAYCVSKAGLAMLTRCWQLEFEASRTAFASVMPGIIDTDMQAVIRQAEDMEPAKNAFFHHLFAEKKLISVDTVAQFLAWLLLTIPASEYVSREWDIYETSHHPQWLKEPYFVPSLETV